MRIKSLMVGALALAASAFVGTQVQASSFFDLAGNGGANFPSMIIDLGDGLNVTVSATTEIESNGSIYEVSRAINQNQEGLGVGLVTEVDGFLISETLWLTFNQTIDFEAISFTGLDVSFDEVRVLDGNGVVLHHYDPLASSPLDISSLNYSGTVIGLKASDVFSSWRVSGVTGTAVVPTPAAAGLMVLGLLTVGMRRRAAAV